MKHCVQFLRDQKLILKDDPFFSTTPSVNTPSLIVAWIMDRFVAVFLERMMSYTLLAAAMKLGSMAQGNQRRSFAMGTLMRKKCAHQ